jgi:hypothetical protein
MAGRLEQQKVGELVAKMAESRAVRLAVKWVD